MPDPINAADKIRQAAQRQTDFQAASREHARQLAATKREALAQGEVTDDGATDQSGPAT